VIIFISGRLIDMSNVISRQVVTNHEIIKEYSDCHASSLGEDSLLVHLDSVFIRKRSFGVLTVSIFSLSCNGQQGKG
jgi:hypothetical protein